MLWTRLAPCFLALGLASGEAHGQPSVPAGRQSSPPGPAAPEEAELPMSEDGRRAVRGCEPDQECATDLMQGLRAFEIEAFPRRRGSSPWSERDGGVIVGPRRVGSARGPVK